MTKSNSTDESTVVLPDPYLVVQHLIAECRPIDGPASNAVVGRRSFRIQEKPTLRARDVGGVVIDGGFDPTHSPLGRPVWLRIERRGDELFYCSSFWMSRDEILSPTRNIALVA